MKNVEDDVNLSINEFYDSIISDYDEMQKFVAKRSEIELVKLYRYVLTRAKDLSQDKEKNADMISYCWLASIELEHTEAIQKYLRGEITLEDIARFDAEQEEINRQILAKIEQKQKDKNRIIKSYSPLGKKIERIKVTSKEFFDKKILGRKR